MGCLNFKILTLAFYGQVQIQPFFFQSTQKGVILAIHQFVLQFNASVEDESLQRLFA
jgi:hypothetical protein